MAKNNYSAMRREIGELRAAARRARVILATLKGVMLGVTSEVEFALAVTYADVDAAIGAIDTATGDVEKI